MPCSTSVTTIALKSRDSASFGNFPVNSRKAMSPRFTLPRISPGRSLPRTTTRSGVHPPRSERIGLRPTLVGLDVRFLHHLRPARHLGLEEGAELLRRAGDHVHAGL